MTTCWRIDGVRLAFGSLEKGRNLLMPTSAWGKTIVIFLQGRACSITSSGDALDALFAHWPIVHGPHYLLAMEACGEAIRGEKAEAKAHSAFIWAVVEAGLYFELK
jgi:Protein of unknown function (DUF982)